VTYPSSLKCTN